MKATIIGGGISGLIAAYTLLDKYKDASITIFEGDLSAGGLLRGTQYEGCGLYFDNGTHIFQETGISEIDQTIMNAIPEKSLIHFPVGQGDLAGSAYGGRLQSNTHFLDLREDIVNLDVVTELRENSMKSSKLPAIDRCRPLKETAIERFGSRFTNNVLSPIMSHLYRLPIEELSTFAMLLPGLTRVVIDDVTDWSSRIKSDRYRSLIAVPDQRSLPKAMHHGRRSYYSRRLGTRLFIDGLVEGLINRGVKVLCRYKVTRLQCSPQQIEVIDSSGNKGSIDSDLIIITTGVSSAARLLGMDARGRTAGSSMPYYLLNILLKEECESDLCYIYGLDHTCDWYRITNYKAITGIKDDRRLTIEIIGRPLPGREKTLKHIMHQLRSLGLVRSEEIEFSDIIQLRSGFPIPSNKNIEYLVSLGKRVCSNLPPNIIVGGIGSGEALFFQNELMISLHRHILGDI